jgi:hypothetical protein
LILAYVKPSGKALRSYCGGNNFSQNDRALAHTVSVSLSATFPLPARDLSPGRTPATVRIAIGASGRDGLSKWWRWRELNRAYLGLPLIHKYLINKWLIYLFPFFNF